MKLEGNVTHLWDFRYYSSNNGSALELGDVGRKSYILGFLAFLRDSLSDDIENCFPSTRDPLEEFDIFLFEAVE